MRRMFGWVRWIDWVLLVNWMAIISLIVLFWYAAWQLFRSMR